MGFRIFERPKKQAPKKRATRKRSYRTCRMCGGSGWYRWDDGRKTVCPSCWGDGTR